MSKLSYFRATQSFNMFTGIATPREIKYSIFPKCIWPWIIKNFFQGLFIKIIQKSVLENTSSEDFYKKSKIIKEVEMIY